MPAHDAASTPSDGPHPAAPGPRRGPRHHAVRSVLSPEHTRAALKIHPADATVAAALRAGLAVCLALTLGHLSPHPEMVGFASLGALTSIYGRYEPYRRRAAVLAIAGAMITLAILVASIGPHLGWSEYASLLVVGLLAGVASLVALALKFGPPGPIMVIFAAGAAVSGSPSLSDIGLRTAFAFGGAALAWLICMSGYLVRPSAPALLAVRRALAPATFDEARVALARDVLADDASHRRTAPMAHELARALAEHENNSRPVPSSATTTPPVSAALPARRTVRSAFRASRATGELTVPALRITVAAIAASFLAHALGWGHPSWAAIGAASTLQGSHIHTTTPRAIQRAVGTAVGALLAWPLLEADLSFWWIVAVVVALQVVTEVIVARQYALAMLTITPMALLMTSFGDHSGGQLALDRGLTTALGALVGVLLTILVHDTWTPRRPRRA
ncbi:Fusaric acid resistance protein-like [Sanguibacter gelidistatuariae]|uniref:Fusaric acid resistance protein-like n=1 Tax=Sanguibacter gelidistatuariae TaxID=1814289 RepID=A0A1G6LAG6_9MICO|nr:FUSC family protein [Sanguibacter gelidistatuariae]SDC40128.1 Fusaric acid resistance protein-like [Sanguibacter gelidistatuariae]